jgi:hypothetical protein
MKTGMSILAALAIVSAPALADGIPMEPGLWKVTTTANMPMMPQPQTMTVEECYEDDSFDMDDMSTGDMDPACTFAMNQVDGNTMSWSVDCPVEGGTMHAEWEATSAGDSVDGEGKMTMNMMGQTMDMTMSWHGERVGDCE